MTRVTKLTEVTRGMTLAATLLALAGCVSPPHEPDYSATWPDPLPTAAQANGAIYQEGHDVALFENSVARRVGDTLTIRLNERTNASKSSTTSTSKATNIDMPSVKRTREPRKLGPSRMVQDSDTW